MDPRPWLQSDSLREREFFKYYDPIRALSGIGPSTIDPTDPTQNAVRARSSPDRALTAFCQLGALRLDAQRCMLFFFDKEHAYVLAEATRTLSLQDDDVHDFDDSLWLGYTVMQRGVSVCEHTVNLDPEDPRTKNGVCVINDLKEDVTFCDRPFVTGGPKARFYAGVPITTPARINIGAYCILDDKPRDGLGSPQMDFLSQMSQTVMSHLEMIRERSELGIGSNMLTGLGSLITNSSAGSAGREAQSYRPAPPQREERSAGSSLPSRFHGALKTDVVDNATSQADSERPPMVKNQDSTTSLSSVTSDSRRGSLSTTQKAREGVHKLFHTAASLLRSAAEVDGSLFLDASIYGYGGTIGSFLPNVTGNASTESIDAPAPDGETATVAFIETSPCRTLGVCETSSLEDGIRPDMSESFLQKLLKKYPRGKVWSFNNNTDVRSTGDTNRRKTTGAHGRYAEVEELQRLFPGARGLCLVGMWDIIRERWYAGTFVWTYSPSRIFSKNTELVFLIAFCDLLMTEIVRLESHLESKAKSDFISSISHELRSPLQGILCGIDLLSEQKSADRPLVSQIEQCSTTLLEIINHLLEFAKINNLSGKAKSLQPTLERHPFDQREILPSSIGQVPMNTHKIGRITEEACDSTFYSHCCSMGQDFRTSVDLILDVSIDANLQSSVDVVAWKRICINVINNSLKYTLKGYVTVSLQARTSESGQTQAFLSVRDTGCGMSSEFLQHRLFHPFQQENDLSTGTGLGMSLVSKLVDTLGGEIEVRSQKNFGTTVTISIPLEGGALNLNEVSASRPCEGIRTRIFKPNSINTDTATTGPSLVLSTLEHTCQRLGAVITSNRDSDADVLIVFEADLPAFEEQTSAIPVIVLCDNFISAHRLREQSATRPSNPQVHCIAQPFGPIRLANAIKTSLETSDDEGDFIDNVGIADGELAPRPTDRAMDPAEIDSPRISKSDSHTNGMLRRPHSNRSANRLPTNMREDKLEEFSLPFHMRPVGGHDSTLPTNGAHEAPGKEVTMSLLLVDDNPINLRMLVAYADRNRYHQLTAVNGREAVDVYMEAAATTVSRDFTNNYVKQPMPRPIVILLDINMPIMDGFEAARLIRVFERSHGIPPAIIIALTGLGSAEAGQKARACGMDLFLTKPVRPKELNEILTSIVSSAPASVQAQAYTEETTAAISSTMSLPNGDSLARPVSSIAIVDRSTQFDSLDRNEPCSPSSEVL